MLYRCRSCRKHFSVMSHTVMHGSKLRARTWLLAVFLIVANPKGKSSVQLAADLAGDTKDGRGISGIAYAALSEKTACPALKGLRKLMRPTSAARLRTCTPKNARNVSKAGGTAGKTPVVGVKDRASLRVAAKPVADTDTATLVGIIEETTQPAVGVFTDGHSGYGKLNSMGFTHDKVKHTDGEYVRDDVSINGIENYWSLLKRCIVGT